MGLPAPKVIDAAGARTKPPRRSHPNDLEFSFAIVSWSASRMVLGQINIEMLRLTKIAKGNVVRRLISALGRSLTPQAFNRCAKVRKLGSKTTSAIGIRTRRAMFCALVPPPGWVRPPPRPFCPSVGSVCHIIGLAKQEPASSVTARP